MREYSRAEYTWLLWLGENALVLDLAVASLIVHWPYSSFSFLCFLLFVVVDNELTNNIITL
jgi:hypothetical protein